MGILPWNIRQGGGASLAAIAAALARHAADVLVISEYRGGGSGERFRDMLSSLGYGYFSSQTPPPGRNGVLIAARQPLSEHLSFAEGAARTYRWLRSKSPA